MIEAARLTEDTLFLACTRPAMIAVVTIFVPAHAQTYAPPAPAPGPHDIAISGVFSPNRVNSDIEADAKKLKDSGAAPLARGRKYYFAFPMPAEFSALAKYTVFLIAVWTQKAEELPVKRVYVRANNQDVPVRKIASWRSEVDPNSLASKIFGANREDGFYLVPMGALLRSGQLLIDLAANRTEWLMLELPSTVAAANREKYPNPDPAPNAKPGLKALQELMQRKFTGFPLPESLP